MKNLRNDYDFNDLVVKYKSEILKDNGDLTVFGGLIFIFYGIALVLAIKKLQRKLKGEKNE